MAELVLGIDGGGTKTELCLVARDGNVVLRARGAGTNPVDNRGWRDNLAALLAGVAPYLGAVAHVVFGVGSYGEAPAVDAVTRNQIAGLVGAPQTLINDVYLAHEAALLGEPGILLIAGTGSMVVASGAQLPPIRVGGWGEMIGDEGSGYWIGREALGRTAEALDGRGDARAFAAAVIAELGISGDNAMDGLLGWLAGLQHPRSEIAALSRLVSRLAEAGDPAAEAILDAAIGHLALLIETGRHRAALSATAPWSAFGGVVTSRAVVAGLQVRLQQEMLPPKLPPVGGAVRRAALSAGWSVDAAWTEHLAQALSQHP